MSRARPPRRYVAATRIGGEPHVVVDGAPRPGTVLTLSHWPGTPTPEALWADTSAEIVLLALDRPRVWPRGVDAVTIDHYDADGVISLALAVDDGLAERHGTLMVRAAHAGDFDVVSGPDAARIAFALGALRGPHDVAGTSPGELWRADGRLDTTAQATVRALALLPELASSPARFEELWGPEDEAYRAAVRMLDAGALSIEERPALDLAVVRVDGAHPSAGAAGWDGAVVHRAALHSATTCLRVATMWGRRYEVAFRYETWVRLGPRRPRPRLRVDLTPLALRLTELETDGGAWAFDGAGAITPRLERADGQESTLAPEAFLAELCAALAALDQVPPAWDPYSRPLSGAPAG